MQKKTGLVIVLLLLTGLTACAKVPEKKQVRVTGQAARQYPSGYIKQSIGTGKKV